MFDWLELLAVLGVIGWRLWTPHHSHLGFGCIFFLYLFLTWIFRGVGEHTQSRESFKEKFRLLGLLPLEWKSRLILLAIAGGVFNLVLYFCLGYAYGGRIFEGREYCSQFLMYVPWAFVQELILNGFFTNRFARVFKGPLAVSLAAGIGFALVHLPNPVLFVVTLVNGTWSAYLFRRTRNAYILAIGHALAGAAISLWLPGYWHHHMRVGLGYFHWHP